MANYRKIVSRAMRGMPLDKRCAAHKAAYENRCGRGFDSFVLIEAANTLWHKGVDTRALVKPELARNWAEQPD